MGCFWSSEHETRERCYECGNKAVNNLIIIDHQCECCRQRAAQRKTARARLNDKFCYGEYTCPCGRSWTSRVSWANRYQICKRCRNCVYATKQRPLKPSDMTDVRETQAEHPRELCQMCQQLGYYCKNFKTAEQRQRRHIKGQPKKF